MLRLSFLLLAASLLTAPCFAQEPVGCDKFKWPIDKERALLAQAAPATPGVSLPATGAFRIALSPIDMASLPTPPSRKPRPGSNAGFIKIAAPQRARSYRITLSDSAWVDVIQDGREIASSAFTGATGCVGVRKSVKFPLAATPFVIEISGAAAASIDIAITPD